MRRLLYLHPGMVPPPADPRLDKFFYLSEIFEGDILTPVWFRDDAEAAQAMGSRFPVSQVGRFRHHVYAAGALSGSSAVWANVNFWIRKGLELHRERKFDYVMTYGTNSTGIAGMVLSYLTGARLIPDLPNAPEHQYLVGAPGKPLSARMKKLVADVLLHLVVSRASIVKRLYPQQLDHYPLLKKVPHVVCPDFAPITYTATQVPEKVEPVILLAGHPWYTKGVDVAIRGFRKIAARFPNHRLVILGMIPDRAPLEKLAEGCSQIEFRRPVPHPEALKLIASCSVYLSASRSEGVARVLMEAMAARRPIVASGVCGTPFLIKDGECGLLFRSEDSDHLAEQLARVLTDNELAARLGEQAYTRIMQHFDEAAYVRYMREMVAKLDGAAVAALKNPSTTAETEERASSLKYANPQNPNTFERPTTQLSFFL